jgi:hypothetical protein
MAAAAVSPGRRILIICRIGGFLHGQCAACGFLLSAPGSQSG